jgi:hypothetical protein
VKSRKSKQKPKNFENPNKKVAYPNKKIANPNKKVANPDKNKSCYHIFFYQNIK